MNSSNPQSKNLEQMSREALKFQPKSLQFFAGATTIQTITQKQIKERQSNSEELTRDELVDSIDGLPLPSVLKRSLLEPRELPNPESLDPSNPVLQLIHILQDDITLESQDKLNEIIGTLGQNEINLRDFLMNSSTIVVNKVALISHLHQSGILHKLGIHNITTRICAEYIVSTYVLLEDASPECVRDCIIRLLQDIKDYNVDHMKTFSNILFLFEKKDLLMSDPLINMLSTAIESILNEFDINNPDHIKTFKSLLVLFEKKDLVISHESVCRMNDIILEILKSDHCSKILTNIQSLMSCREGLLLLEPLSNALGDVLRNNVQNDHTKNQSRRILNTIFRKINLKSQPIRQWVQQSDSRPPRHRRSRESSERGFHL